MINLEDPESRVATTGEYVLGTLSDEDQAAFREALTRDAALQAEVYGWQDHLLSLSVKATPVAPRPQLWQRIDATLGAVAAPRSARAEGAGRSSDPWWQRLGWWQSVSGMAVALCLVMAVLLVDRGAGVPGQAGAGRYLAVLQSPKDHTAGWLVEVQGDTVRLLPMGAASVVPPGRALQFWTKPQGARGPTSLGLVRAGHPLELPVSRLPGVGAQQLFEITLEPEQGSPIDRPTGPILYVGRTVAL